LEFDDALSSPVSGLFKAFVPWDALYEFLPLIPRWNRWAAVQVREKSGILLLITYYKKFMGRQSGLSCEWCFMLINKGKQNKHKGASL